MQTRKRNALLFAGAAALAASALVMSVRRAAPAKERVLTAIPKETMLLVTADLAAMRRSSIFSEMVEGERELPGVGKLSDACGFDPVTRFSEIAMAIPPGDGDDWGIVALGSTEAAELVECASTLLAKRGGEALVETAGTFTTVRDARGMHSGQIAVRQGGPVLLGEGTFLRTMMQTVEGKEPNAETTAHPELRENVGRGAMVATVVFPEELKARVREEFGEQDLPAMRIESAALAITTEPNVGIRALAGCDATEPCAQLAESLRESRRETAKTMGARLLGLGSMLDRVAITANGKRIDARLELSKEEASAILDKLLALQAMRRALVAEDDAREPPMADELLKPRPD